MRVNIYNAGVTLDLSDVDESDITVEVSGTTAYYYGEIYGYANLEGSEISCLQDLHITEGEWIELGRYHEYNYTAGDTESALKHLLELGSKDKFEVIMQLIKSYGPDNLLNDAVRL